MLLPATSGSLAVVTSRRPLLGLVATGAYAVQVEPLDPPSALELLTRTIGADRVAAERDQAERLVGLCGGLPIALCVAAARIASRPRRSLARMIGELHDERARLDALPAEGDLSVRATFDIAYGDLPPPLRRVYRTLGLFPGKVFGVEAAAAALGVGRQRCPDQCTETPRPRLPATRPCRPGPLPRRPTTAAGTCPG